MPLKYHSAKVLADQEQRIFGVQTVNSPSPKNTGVKSAQHHADDQRAFKSDENS